jgi:hypothetical protein
MTRSRVEKRPCGLDCGYCCTGTAQGGVAMDPNPDYDASDELEYGFAAVGWLLRGVYPPPAYPPV